ncbi:aminotransferase class I/II-fold pyridoxal phosphate-dependent enzyme [Pseudidiomarina salilacus]|uniref:aminotransferase class I/II-fold pyridoxal phosphate-dependent enzyme n=1 Tax=Pseudidiomarina salilacus TaxID=3384452 RepID=UPI00398522B9
MQAKVQAQIQAQLASRQQRQRCRQLTTVTSTASELQLAGQRYLHFSSNDYLGLSTHPAVRAAWCSLATVGSRASTLVTGYQTEHARLSAQLAEFLGYEAVVLFGSAFAANSGGLATLGRLYDKLWLDRLAHASIIAGAQQSGQSWRRFRHNQLQTMTPGSEGTCELVVTESVFSMDGDQLPLTDYAQLQHQRPQVDWWLDDAHGFGVLGDEGRGIVELMQQAPTYLVLAFGKACGVAGGAIACSADAANYLINYCPELIYSTAMPAAQAAAISAAVEVICQAEGQQLRSRLAANVRLFRELAQQRELPVSASAHAIQTLVLGTDERALAVSAKLRAQGIWCSAIRPPTVPEGTARLRLTLTAAHTEVHIHRLIDALASALDAP